MDRLARLILGGITAWMPIAAPAEGASLDLRLRGEPSRIAAVRELILVPSRENPVPRRLRASERVEIELEGTQTWQLSCAREGVWCPTLTVTRGRAQLELPVYSSALLTARVRTPSNQRAPKELLVQGWIRDGSELPAPRALSLPAPEASTFVAQVPIEDGQIQLIGPDTTLDLRLGAAGPSPTSPPGSPSSQVRERRTAMPSLEDLAGRCSRWF